MFKNKRKIKFLVPLMLSGGILPLVSSVSMDLKTNSQDINDDISIDNNITKNQKVNINKHGTFKNSMDKLINSQNKKYDYGYYVLDEHKNALFYLNENQRYDIGSQTKMFTALTIYKLSEILKDQDSSEDLLNTELNDIFNNPNSEEIKFLKEMNSFINKRVTGDVDFRYLKVKDLIEHTSGLPDYANLVQATYNKKEKKYKYPQISDNKAYNIFENHYTSKSSNGLHFEWKLEDIAQIIKENIKFPKDIDISKPKSDINFFTTTGYNNTGFYLAGKVIEEIYNNKIKNIDKNTNDKLDLEEIFNKYIFQPLAMNNTSFTKNGNYKNGKLNDHDVQDIGNKSLFYAAGGVVSTLKDMAEFIYAVKNDDDRLLKKETFDLWKNNSDLLLSNGEALGSGLYELPIKSSDGSNIYEVIGHFGQSMGYWSRSFASSTDKGSQIYGSIFVNNSAWVSNGPKEGMEFDNNIRLIFESQ